MAIKSDAISVELTYRQATILRRLLREEATKEGYQRDMEINSGSLLGELRAIDRKIRAGMQPGDFE